jgi:hypothetical protein
MTPEEFVAILRKVVLEAAVEATLANLQRPPGRRPKQALLDASALYQRLSDENRILLENVMRMTAHHAVFGLLAVLDGMRVVEDSPDKGNFRLTFQKGDLEWELNPSDGIPLHAILNQQDASDQ